MYMPILGQKYICVLNNMIDSYLPKMGVYWCPFIEKHLNIKPKEYKNFSYDDPKAIEGSTSLVIEPTAGQVTVRHLSQVKKKKRTATFYCNEK